MTVIEKEPVQLSEKGEGDDPLAPYRSRLLGLAYRMLASRMDAEDVLQDAYIRFCSAGAVNNVEAFLVTTVTRLCLDRLKSAQTRRELYIGPWLPEPLADVAEISPHTERELADDLSFAFMIILERMSAPERAAFLLHDVFDLPYSAISGILERSEAACRQLASRARKAVRNVRQASKGPPGEHARLFAAFRTAIAEGEIMALAALLRDDAVLYSDGGGHKMAARNPIVGSGKIARFFDGAIRKFGNEHRGAETLVRLINGHPGVLMFRNEELVQTMSIDVEGGKIAAVYMVSNPEKLRWLGATVQGPVLRW